MGIFRNGDARFPISYAKIAETIRWHIFCNIVII